jgi:hypothetical protein
MVKAFLNREIGLFAGFLPGFSVFKTLAFGIFLKLINFLLVLC